VRTPQHMPDCRSLFVTRKRGISYTCDNIRVKLKCESQVCNFICSSFFKSVAKLVMSCLGNKGMFVLWDWGQVSVGVCGHRRPVRVVTSCQRSGCPLPVYLVSSFFYFVVF
jgi:hypothetical protein